MITNLNGTATWEVGDRNGVTVRARRVEEQGWAGHCRTTHWSIVLAAGAGGAAARVALSRLYRAYWYPVFAVVAKARGREAAAELTQEFFVSRLVEGSDLSRVSRRPGERFRGWLFTALRSFLMNQWQHERRKCRDVRCTVQLVGDADDGELGPRVSALGDTKPNPEQRLAREQALSLLSDVLRRLRREYCARASAAGVNGQLRFDAVKVFLPGPNTETADYRAVALSLGLNTDAVKQMVCRLRARFGHLLHDELAKTKAGAEDVATARRLLCQALAGGAPSEGMIVGRNGAGARAALF